MSSNAADIAKTLNHQDDEGHQKPLASYRQVTEMQGSQMIVHALQSYNPHQLRDDGKGYGRYVNMFEPINLPEGSVELNWAHKKQYMYCLSRQRCAPGVWVSVVTGHRIMGDKMLIFETIKIFPLKD